ncbi:succinate dehydrogenase assembly factor 2 [Tepidamorphus sp. 3E244]|uniref:FAD assembly factor SdhE n=1 Tax=Tepidamorphus sp. 3E244 TaxID=3385498 RepID=UPI0038FC7747
MTGTTLSSEKLDPRRRRALFRAWRRGTREMDLMVGRFADDRLETMSDDDLAVFEELIDAPDVELFDWVTGAQPVPEAYDTPVFAALREFSLATEPGTLAR